MMSFRHTAWVATHAVGRVFPPEFTLGREAPAKPFIESTQLVLTHPPLHHRVRERPNPVDRDLDGVAGVQSKLVLRHNPRAGE